MRAVLQLLASEREELTVLLGVVLLGAGLWMVSPAAALIATGLVLLWIALPQRRSFIQRTPTVSKRGRRGLEE